MAARWAARVGVAVSEGATERMDAFDTLTTAMFAPAPPAMGLPQAPLPFPALATTKLRVVLHHADGGKSGVTEFEAWGDGSLPAESSGS